MTQASNLAKGGTNFNASGQLSLTTGVTGTLPVANGGTGTTSSTGSGAVVLATSPTLVTPALGTPSAVVLTNATSVPVNQATGTLPVANGGTGLTALGTAGQVLTVNSGATALQYSTPTTTAPGGSTTQVQYNNAGAFAGSANLTFDGNNLSVAGTTANLYVNSNTAGNNANLFLRSAGADTFGIEAQSSTGGNNTYLSNRVTSGGLYFRTTNSSGTLNTQAAVDPSGLLQFNSGYGSVATAYGCRAWCNFNGTNGAIRASGNISSVTRNGTGNYTVNFSTAMPDANYAVSISSQRNYSGTQNAGFAYMYAGTSVQQTASSFSFYTSDQTTGGVDSLVGMVAVFR